MTQEKQNSFRVVTLRGILHLMKKGWYLVLAVILLSGLIAANKAVSAQREKVAAAGGKSKKTVSLKVDEAGFLNVKAAADLEDAIAEKQKYVDESLLLQIDPMHKWNANLRFRFSFTAEQEKAASETGITEEEKAWFEAKRQQLAAAYSAVFRAQDTYDKIMERSALGTETSYLNEIMAGEATSVPGTFYVWCVGSSRERTEALLNAIEATVGEMKNVGTDLAGAYEVTIERTDAYETVDAALVDTKAAKLADLSNQQAALANKMNALTEDDLKYLDAYRTARFEEDYKDGMTLKKKESVDLPSDDYKTLFRQEGLKGLGIGVLISILLAFLVFVLSPVLLSAQSVTDMYELPVFARAGKNKDAGAQTELMKEIILGEHSEGKLALVSSNGQILERAGARELTDKLKEADLQIVTAAGIQKSSQDLARLRDVTKVYLVEQVGKSRHRDLEQEMVLLAEMGIRTGGVFLV